MAKEEVVRTGTWEDYEGAVCVTNDVRIIQSDTIYGSENAENPPEIRMDRKVSCYYIQYLFESDVPKHPIRMNKHFLTLEEAIKMAEEKTKQSIQWKEE